MQAISFSTRSQGRGKPKRMPAPMPWQLLQRLAPPRPFSVKYGTLPSFR